VPEATYTKERFVVLEYLSDAIVAELAEEFGEPATVTISDHGNWFVDQVVMRVVQSIFTREIDEFTVEYPADWWQAFKDRWFPEWAKKRWPVEKRVTVITAREMLPKMASPDGRLNLDIHTYNLPLGDEVDEFD
jgi:hypothetical protein